MKMISLKNNALVLIIILSLIQSGCKREDRLDFIDQNAPAPAQITNVKITATPGGALLNYRLPKDGNLSYVKAIYEIQPGVFREAKSSQYKDTLTLVGYGDTSTHSVKIFSVGKNEKSSEPLVVSVVPLAPPVITVFKNLTLAATFGGVTIRMDNKTGANLSVELITDSLENGIWGTLNTFYTKSKAGVFSFRGLHPNKKKFGVIIRDRWNNKSDTLKKELTPLFEEIIPSTNFSVLVLPTDITTPAEPGYALPNVFNGGTNWQGIWASPNSSKIPQWFTLDLGKPVLLSRMKTFVPDSHHFYQGSAMKKFEIWGANHPNPNGSYDSSWTLLGTFESYKPSGLPLGQTNQDDLNYAVINGEDFEFDSSIPAVRYIRVKALESYSSPGQIVISELKFWGQLK